MKLSHAFASVLLVLFLLAACGTSPTGPTEPADEPRTDQSTHHGSGG